MTGNRDNDIKSVVSVLNEIQVEEMNIEVATDNERYLVDVLSRELTKNAKAIEGTFRRINLRQRVLNEQYA